MATAEASIQQPTMSSHTWRHLDMVLITVVCIVGFFVGFIPLIIAATALDGQEAITNGGSLIVILGTLILQPVSLILSVYAGLRWRKLTWQDLWLNALSWRWVALLVVLALVLRIPIIAINYALVALGLELENPQIAVLAPENLTLLTGIGIFLLAGIAVPIAEEFFFRGVLYRWARRWGVVVATSVSSLVFALVHVAPVVVVSAFFLGVATALVYERTKSLWAPTLLHIVFNSSALLLLYGLMAFGIEIPGM